MNLLHVPRVLLRLEGLIVFAASLALYVDADYRIVALIALFLAPDLSLFGYLVSPRFGATTYNAVHIYMGPVALGAVGVLTSSDVPAQIALVWLAHLGGDRALGYGLKYPQDLKGSHLQRV